MLTLVDEFGASTVIYVIVIFETAGVCWVYGLSNLRRDIEFMVKRPVSWYWRICWGIIIPVGLSIILIYKFSGLEPLTHGGVDFPPAALGIAETCLFLSILGFKFLF